MVRIDIAKLFLLKRKRGVIMDLFLVFMTIVFCSLVIIAYLQSQDNLNASLVSPVSILKLTDEKNVFEKQEFLLLSKVYCAGGDSDDIKNRFCNGFGNLEGNNFLLSNTESLEASSGITSGNLCDKVYSFEKGGGDLKIVRSGLVKRESLSAVLKSSNKVRFDVDLEFHLEKEYLLSKEDC